MATKNDITGDTVTSRPASDNYRDNYDAIFRKKEIPRIEAIGQNGNEGLHYHELQEKK